VRLFARFIVLFLTCCLFYIGTFFCVDYTHSSDDIITKEFSFGGNDRYAVDSSLNECVNKVTNEGIIVEKSFLWGTEKDKDNYPIIVGYVIKSAYTEYINRFERLLSEFGFTKGVYYTGDNILEKIRNLIYVDFEERGYNYTVVSVTADAPIRDDRKVITIDIKNVGERDHIDKINIAGNKNVKTSTILNSLTALAVKIVISTKS
jgi:hypothetical protein